MTKKPFLQMTDARIFNWIINFAKKIYDKKW